MANDEIERWMHRRDMYLLRRAPDEVMQAAHVAARMVGGQALANTAMHNMVSVHGEANGIIRDNPGVEFPIRDLEATYQAGCIAALKWYLLR